MYAYAVRAREKEVGEKIAFAACKSAVHALAGIYPRQAETCMVEIVGLEPTSILRGGPNQYVCPSVRARRECVSWVLKTKKISPAPCESKVLYNVLCY